MAREAGSYEENRFIMLGVIHGDENGPQLLMRWLEMIKPHVITLEFSKYGLAFRQSRGQYFRQRLAEAMKGLQRHRGREGAGPLADIVGFLGLPYEYEVTSRYCEDHGAHLYLIDMDYFSYMKLRKTEELLAPENLEKLAEEEAPRTSTHEKTLARLFFDDGVKTIPYSDEMCIRDWYMRQKIAVLMKYHGKKRFLHVCGWQHLQDPCNLFGPLDPIKVFVYDETLCV